VRQSPPVHEEPEEYVAPPASEASAHAFSRCSAGEFECVNGTSHNGPCISLSAKCDSFNDCSDASDEIGCMEEKCQGNFQVLFLY
jgi:Low-density lipoprotein receptor domain class A